MYRLDCQSPASFGKHLGVAEIPSEHVPQFDVVSIKPSRKDSGGSFSVTSDGLSATGQSVTSLILAAYFPMALWSADRVQNLPAWATKEEYDIEAKVAPQDISAWGSRNGSELQMAMLRSMLADRFKLVSHTVPNEAPGFALIIAKRSAGLKQATPSENLPHGVRMAFGGVAYPRSTPEGQVWSFYVVSMASLAEYLSHGSHTIVEDHTGLTGSYDFDLHRRDDADPIDHGDIKDPASKWEFGPLGLKTVGWKVHSKNIVIDHVEKPSPN